MEISLRAVIAMLAVYAIIQVCYGVAWCVVWFIKGEKP